MTKKKEEQAEQPPTDNLVHTDPPAQAEPIPPATEPATEEPSTETSETSEVVTHEKEVKDEEPNHAQTAKELLQPFKQLIDDPNKPRALKVRTILKRLHEEGKVTLLGNELYYAVRSELADIFSVTNQAIEKQARQVVEVADDDASDRIEVPSEPEDIEPSNPAPLAPAAGSGTGGGAPFGGSSSSTFTATSESGETIPAEEKMVWDKKKVGRIMALPVNFGTILSDAWVPLSKAEREELGDSFLQIFKDYLPTTKKTGSFLAAMAAMEMILMPRISGMLKARKQGADIEKIKEEVRNKIKEAVESD